MQNMAGRVTAALTAAVGLVVVGVAVFSGGGQVAAPTVVWVEDGTLRIEAAASRDNNLVVLLRGPRVRPSEIEVRDVGGAMMTMPPCGRTGDDPSRVTCPRGVVARLDVYSGDGNDRITNTTDLRASLVAGSGDDKVLTGDGEELIELGPGDDYTDSSTGADTVIGGTGTDTVDYGRRTASVAVSLDNTANDGEPKENDDVRSDVETIVGGVGNDVLVGSEHNNTFIDSAGDDLIRGLGGDDVFQVGLGKDDLLGGAGVDSATYVMHPTGVAVSLDDNANDGRSNEADNIHSDIENVTGTNHGDSLLGSAAANVLRGAGGDDRVFGREGDDWLIGDSGNDQGFGGAGHDNCTTELTSSCS